MHVAAGLAALLDELVHQRQNRIADDVGLMPQVIEIEGVHIDTGGDLVSRVSGITPQRASARASATSTST